jgi:hypothetical protein
VPDAPAVPAAVQHEAHEHPQRDQPEAEQLPLLARERAGTRDPQARGPQPAEPSAR